MFRVRMIVRMIVIAEVTVINGRSNPASLEYIEILLLTIYSSSQKVSWTVT